MGCRPSVEVDSNGLQKCSAIVKRRLLVLRYHQECSSREKPASGYHYELDHDIVFHADNLDGYSVVRPLECNLELAAAVSEQLKKHKYSEWTFVCQLRNGSRKLLPSMNADQPQPEIVLIQKVWFCGCKNSKNHDVTLAAEEDRGVEEPVRSQRSQRQVMEIREDPPQYQRGV
jgi:hypothetical protein